MALLELETEPESEDGVPGEVLDVRFDVGLLRNRGVDHRVRVGCQRDVRRPLVKSADVHEEAQTPACGHRIAESDAGIRRDRQAALNLDR